MATKLLYLICIFLTPIILGNLTNVKSTPVKTVEIRVPIPNRSYKPLIDNMNTVQLQLDSTTFETELGLIYLKSQQELLITLNKE